MINLINCLQVGKAKHQYLGFQMVADLRCAFWGCLQWELHNNHPIFTHIFT